MCSSHLLAAALENQTPHTPEPAAESAGGTLEPSRVRSVADLTHTLTPDFPVFPGYQPLRIRRLATVDEDGYASNELVLAEHIGTHLDAPAHFFVDGIGTDRLPVAHLLAPLVVISIAERAASDHDATLDIGDLLSWERRHGAIPDGAVVALYSAWEERLRTPGAFVNADAGGVLHSPGFSREAAEFLVAERRVVGAATDTLSLDIGASTTYDAHKVLLGGGKYGLENVANLARVPLHGAYVMVGAPKHLNGTGGPCRLLALF